MNQNKRKAAEYLFDEIGEIDDSIIAAAESFRPSKKVFDVKRAVVFAAAAAVSVSLLVAVFLIGKLNDGSSPPPIDHGKLPVQDNEATEDNELPPPQDSSPESFTFATQLSAIRGDDKAKATEKQDIKFFDGYARLIWKFSDEDYYRVCKINSYQLGQITKAIEQNSGTPVSPQYREDGLEGFWISLGDGKVITPYLLSSEGNVGYGTLFDYNIEVEPSQSLAQYICGIIER